jgi:LuxR family maltose regulon positive regulatory protein
LWRYVATAVDRVRPGLGRAALQRLGAAGGPVEAAVDELMNGVAALGSELFVVLDDLHAVTNEECLSSLDYALAHRPPNAHVLVVARADPALRLASLRAASALVEVRVAELAFTAAEAHELLVVLGRLELGAPEIDAVVERTEGWPAALVRVVVASDRQGPGTGRARVRRNSSFRGRVPQWRGSRGARRGPPNVPRRTIGPR